jgi:hypothetical protein
VWLALGIWLVPRLITQAYLGKSVAALNAFFVGQPHPLVFYLQQWSAILYLGIFFWIGLWAFALVLHSPRFWQRYVGEAPPEALGALRILTCSILLLSTLWEDLPSTAALPRGLARSMGVLDILYALPSGFSWVVSNATALTVFQAGTAVLLGLGALGYRTRLTVPLAAGAYLLLGGILRQYAWFYHTGLVPAYVLAFLSCTPCGDGWSLDRLRRVRRGQPVPPSWQPAACYGWARYGCWMLIALPYVAAGLSKLRNGGLWWWEATNFRHILYRSVLSPMQFDFDGALALTRVPDAAVAMLGLLALLGEVLYGLVLFSRLARRVLPLLMVAMHAGILGLQNILFFDLILLQLAFVDLVHQGGSSSPVPNSATAPGKPRKHPAKLAGYLRYAVLWKWRAWLASSVPETAVLHPGSPSATLHYYPRLLFGVSSVLLLCWLCRLEFYPFTGMQMFSAYNTSGIVTYDKVFAYEASGSVVRAPIEQCLGAMADGRYRRVLAMAWEARHHEVCTRFFQTCGQRWNQLARGEKQIVQFEVQRWEWDFRSRPQDPTHGQMLARRFYPLQ